MTWKQKKRQEVRDGASGQYTRMNPCECCGRGTGSSYYSDERCNVAKGHGLILCGGCCDEVAKLDDAGYLARFGLAPTPELLARMAGMRAGAHEGGGV